MRRDGFIDGLAALSHALHGTRGLAVGAFGLLLLTLVEPAMPGGTSRLGLVTPILLVLANGLATLPREGVAVQHRAIALLDRKNPTDPMLKRLGWIGLLVVLLLPRVFFAGYGIPTLSPLAGLVPASLQARISVAFVFIVLLLPILYLRSNLRYAPEIRAMRPIDLPEGHPDHSKRDVILALVAATCILFGLLLHDFWQPFTLLEFPPGFESLQKGASGVHRLAFSVVVPAALFVGVAAHAQLLQLMWKTGRLRSHRGIGALAAAHIGLGLIAIGLHTYDLLWIVRYQSAWSL